MSRFSDYWASQCGNPRGVIGKIMTWSMNRANRVIYRGIVDEINIYNDMKLLDIGFGNGYLDKLIYRKGKCFIQGIDISEDMVKLANANNRTVVDNGDMKFDIGDCCDLSYADSSFDVVVTMNTIYFWKDTLEGLREIYRVLKENGIFYNAVLTKESLDKVFYTKNGFKKFTEEDYINLGKQVGFKNISVKGLGRAYGLLITYEK